MDEFCKEYQKKGYIIVGEPSKVRCGKVAVLEDLDEKKTRIIDLSKFGNEPRYER